jgi:hypothetical protein
MAGSDRLGWDTVALAGRGIAAYSAAQLWMINEGKASVDPLRLADLVIEFGMAVEQLPELWERYSNGDIPDPEFQSSLEAIVEQLESWPGLERS